MCHGPPLGKLHSQPQVYWVACFLGLSTPWTSGPLSERGSATSTFIALAAKAD